MGENFEAHSCNVDGVERINDYETVIGYMNESLDFKYDYTIDTDTFEDSIVLSIKNMSNNAGARIKIQPCDLDTINNYILGRRDNDPNVTLEGIQLTGIENHYLEDKLSHIGII